MQCAYALLDAESGVARTLRHRHPWGLHVQNWSRRPSLDRRRLGVQDQRAAAAAAVAGQAHGVEEGAEGAGCGDSMAEGSTAAMTRHEDAAAAVVAAVVRGHGGAYRGVSMVEHDTGVADLWVQTAPS
jgi:hypothetical protein